MRLLDKKRMLRKARSEVSHQLAHLRARWGAKLAVSLETDMSISAGVAKVTVHLPEKIPGDCVLNVRCTSSGANASQDFGQLTAGSTLSVGVHTYMLPLGQQVLTFALSSGQTMLTSTQMVLTVQYGPGLAYEVAESLRENGVPVFFLGHCDSSFYPYESEAARPWFDRPDARQHIDSLVRENKITAHEATALAHFVDNGFLVLEDLIDDALIASINTDIDKVVSSGYQGYERGSSQRLEHLHLSYPNIRKLWLDPRYLRYVDLIFAADARPCQTLTYVFGSQQDAHQDTVHLTPYPAGYMCGTWIALQDVVPESGELVVYPGSHREKRVYLQGTGCEKIDGDWSDFGKKVVPIWHEMTSRYQPMVYRPRKGTVLIWHENLLHAGSARANMSLERRSIVIHSFAEGAIVYYDSTGKVGTAVRRQDMATA